ncbi:DUF262 domain-containing protein [Pantoea dispersa]|uniref:DUF262 domain-containing protein n=1 Tax=Pantoea dispersa TaxID=59814 RepID=UPI0032B595EE
MGDRFEESFGAFGGSFRSKIVAFSAAYIIDMVQRGRLDVNPYFKNHIRWSISKSSKLIESIILGFPLQSIFCEENNFGALVILDGSQIVSALHRFSQGEFKLRGLDIRKDLNGLSIYDLNYRDYNLIMDRYQLNFSIINYDTNPFLKYEFCKRINSGNRGFLPQSARNYAFTKMSSTLESIKPELKEYIYFETVSFSRRSKQSSDKILSLEIDQFLLYLCMLVFHHHTLLRFDEDKCTLSEALDQAAYFFETNWQAEGVGKYLLGIIRDMLRFLELTNPDVVLGGLGFEDKEFNFREIRKTSEISAQDFIHAFILFLSGKYSNAREFTRALEKYPVINYLESTSRVGFILERGFYD